MKVRILRVSTNRYEKWIPCEIYEIPKFTWISLSSKQQIVQSKKSFLWPLLNSRLIWVDFTFLSFHFGWPENENRLFSDFRGSHFHTKFIFHVCYVCLERPLAYHLNRVRACTNRMWKVNSVWILRNSKINVKFTLFQTANRSIREKFFTDRFRILARFESISHSWAFILGVPKTENSYFKIFDGPIF